MVFNYELCYTKHYYAGSQRINSKLGKGKDVGLFNCAWLIIPYGSGAASINEKVVAKEKLDANTAASLAIMAANGITPPPNYGQNAGYTENCVPSYTGVEEKDTYWYHPDHLGSSSFITGLDGEVTQNIEYFPSGEVFVENHKNSYNTPYKFNGKEQDDETGYYYYGARYYNPRVSLWLNVDPLAEYNPFMNDQAYIDGQHNGGVYNSGNNNPYIYTYQNPIRYIDPNGKQVEWELLYDKWPKTADDMTWKDGEVSNLDIFSYVYGENYDRQSEALKLPGQKPINMTNACATRGSIAYNRMGFGKYLISDFKGWSGKMKDLKITSTAGQFKAVLDKIYKGNEDKIIEVKNPTSEEEVQKAFGGKKGTYVMIARKDAGYTGHVTIYNGKKVIGDNDHMYLKDAKAVYLYVADKDKDKNNKQSK